jgi:transposase InsO family protein
VHDLARAEGVSVNALALRGLSRLCAERGVPPL